MGEKANNQELDLSKICIGITKIEESGAFTYEKEKSDAGVKVYSKIKNGLLKIKLEWLEKNKTYQLKIIYTHHLKQNAAFEKKSRTAKPSDKDREIKEKITNVSSFEKEHLTSSYNGYKKQCKHGYRFENKGSKQKVYYGFESDGWDIAIYLNDKLIYKEEKGKEPEYFIVKKL